MATLSRLVAARLAQYWPWMATVFCSVSTACGHGGRASSAWQIWRRKYFWPFVANIFLVLDYSYLVQRVPHERPGALLRGVAERVQAVAAL